MCMKLQYQLRNLMASKMFLFSDSSKNLLNQIPDSVQKVICVFLDTDSKMQLALTSKSRKPSLTQRFQYFSHKDEEWMNAHDRSIYDSRDHIDEFWKNFFDTVQQSRDQEMLQSQAFWNRVLMMVRRSQIYDML